MAIVLTIKVLPEDDLRGNRLQIYFFKYFVFFKISDIHHYNPSVRIATQLLTPHKLCALILYISGGTCNLKSIPNHRFLRSFLWQLYLLSVFLPELC